MNDSIQNALTYSLIFMIGVLVILVIIFVILKLKERQEDNPKKDKKEWLYISPTANLDNHTSTTNKIVYSKRSKTYRFASIFIYSPKNTTMR